MKKILALVPLSSLVLGYASLAGAEDKVKFYDFNTQLIEADVKRPTDQVIEGKRRIIFGKLLELKKSFRPAMSESARDRELK